VLGAALALELAHQPAPPATQALTLISRHDQGEEVQAPTAILHFALPHASIWQRLTGDRFGRFVAVDLVGIVAEGSPPPRLYSLASARLDGFLEIVVKKHAGGLCSGQLNALMPGETAAAFLRPNPGFHAGRGRGPLILIGAGAGIAPLTGLVRGNRGRRPIHLFFGMRHPGGDFFYAKDLADWQAGGRITRLITAASRTTTPRYVQDAVRRDGPEVARLIASGARVMVCGGRDMAAGAADAMAEILATAGLTPPALKAEGRYVEDIF
jgi:sulfite reductase (NADPH) flavoprotein alpha-component